MSFRFRLAEKHGACRECSTDRIIVWHDREHEARLREAEAKQTGDAA